jgi:hypothetical protein
MLNRHTIQNRFLAGTLAALAVSVLVIFAALTQALSYSAAYA